MVKNFLKKQNGVALTDIIIAICIFSLFTTLIVSISYNIYITSNFIKRNSKATNYIIDVFEYIEKISYDEVNFQDEELKEELNTLLNTNTGYIDDNKEFYECQKGGYKINIFIEKYIPEQETEENTLDVVKIITAKIEYKLKNNTKEITMSKLKTREKHLGN